MSKIDYQKLREIAEKTKIAGEAPVMPFDQRINALNDFMKHFSPDIALALLDERERNQQYIKSRDQENEEIALTVGKLRVELEAADNNLIDSECHVAELEEALRDKQALLEASEKRIAELEAREIKPAKGEVLVVVSGFTGCGKSAIAGEIEIAMKAIGVPVKWTNGDAEKRMTGNSPVIPDGWISCSERMPEKNQNVLISVNFDSSLVEPLICSARYTGSTFRRGDATIKPGNGIEQATHWMPLPEPPQEVNRG
ncbi:ead/Ea22-like family protein [Escherichia coli]|uniref:ead/Ea22-like family protein n=2 Tax=Escherichia coli TaxID=562 RepID=UPI002410C4AF|nr:ead/Ea22-like family protein [Escherichia coli]EJG6341300.1 ead/Ea22-like family protein [Escherichia coli]EJI3260859.1 ead/Ea22-like family protein [Escherichia coli]EJS8696091.1 ead/Ea22-like family protein [Escherichia coli]EKG1488223.1 ead/Ea22-like family protein [Escherichia coli]